LHDEADAHVTALLCLAVMLPAPPSASTTSHRPVETVRLATEASVYGSRRVTRDNPNAPTVGTPGSTSRSAMAGAGTGRPGR